MQRLNKKQTVSDSSALHTELLSSPGPLAKELQYVGADVKQSVITDKNIIPESTRQVQQQNSVNRTKQQHGGAECPSCTESKIYDGTV